MILNFFIKCLLVGFFTIWLSSCERHSQGNTSTKTESSTGTEPTQSAPPVVISPDADTTIQEQKENILPTTVSSETTQNPENSTPSPVAPSTDTARQEQTENVLPTTVSSETTQTPKDGTPSVSISSEIKRPSRFPLHIGKQWNISREDIINAGFLEEGGSELFHYYIQFWFNAIGVMLESTNTEYRKYKGSWDQLCYKSDCMNGFDLKKIDKPMMQDIIKQLAYIPRVRIASNPANPDMESTFFLQGLLALPDDVKPPSYNNLKEGEDPPHIQSIKQTIEVMKELNVKRIAVNLPFQPHTDLKPFFHLGNFIKEKQMDLHIVGGCGPYCARYLIPAAKTVHIEPYGHIYFNGSFIGLFQEIMKVHPIQAEADKKLWRKEWLPQLENKIDFVDTGLRQIITDSQSRTLFTTILLRQWDAKGVEEFHQKFESFLFTVDNKTSFKAFTKQEGKSFLKSLSEELLNSLALFFKREIDEQVLKRAQYADVLKTLGQDESNYYGSIGINTLPFTQNYSYFSLLYVAAQLVQDLEYEEHFSVPKLYYNVPEKDKPYNTIFPSAALLKSVGIDVRGENNIKIGGIDENSKIGGLYLNSKRIENCKFFEEGVSYTTETLYDCLFE